MKQRIERYLPTAIEAVNTFKISENNEVDNQYKGYISSMGASVIQTGLLPTIAFYSSQSSKSEKDRRKIMDSVFWIVGKCEGIHNLTKISKNNDNITIAEDLLQFADKYENEELLLNRLLDAATALKLAIRTFAIKKKEEN